MAWDAAKEMVDEEEVRTIFMDTIVVEASLGIPEIRVGRQAPKRPGLDERIEGSKLRLINRCV